MGKSEKDEEKNSREALLLERKKAIYNLILLSAASFVVLIGAITMAWFSDNEKVNGTNMSVTVAYEGFELQVRGTNIANEDVYSGFSIFTNEIGNGVLDENHNVANVYETGGGFNKIVWRKESLAGFYPEGLKPGSYGKLNFWIIPGSGNMQNVVFRFSIRGFYAKRDAEGNVTAIYELTDELEPTAENGLTQDSLEAKMEALDYIKGHILFFKNYSEGFYDGFSENRSFGFDEFLEEDATVVAGNEYPVEVYWKWVNSFADMVLDDTSQYKDRPLLASGNVEDLASIYDYLEDTTLNLVFCGLDSAVIMSHLNALRDENAQNDYDSLEALCTAYDNGDQEIGNNLDFILIEMSAE